jgi:hypothetical protein
MTEKRMSNEDYKKGYADGFQAGFELAKKQPVDIVNPNPLSPNIWRNNPPGSPSYGCAVCGLSYKDGAMGYVCPRTDCPSRVYCGTEVGYTTGGT